MSHWRPSPTLQASALLHAGALAGMLLEPGSWPAAAGALAANHVILSTAGLPRCTLLGPNLTRLPRRRGSPRRGGHQHRRRPRPEITPGCSTSSTPPTPGQLLLHRPAGPAHPGLVRDIINRGHRIENHSEHHWKRFSTLGPSAMVRKWRRPRPASRP
jgi:hypothetical protein